MFTFETEQKVCEVGGVKFGGQPGGYPTVICSSIFQKASVATLFSRQEMYGDRESGRKGLAHGVS